MFDDFDSDKKNHLPSEIVNTGAIDDENQMIATDEGKIEIIINKDSKVVNITRDVVKGIVQGFIEGIISEVFDNAITFKHKDSYSKSKGKRQNQNCKCNRGYKNK